ncbi:MAG: hypothetical protein M3M88_07870 [Thermoproteota archaeon]|nr:hypothetical protein [Thermoproteota archaeon]
MTNMPIPESTTTGQPAPMSRTGKASEFMHAAIMQSIFTDCCTETKLLDLFHPLVLRMGAWFLVVPISDVAKFSANEISWRPRKLIPGWLVEGFSVACGSSPLDTMLMQFQSSQ